MLPELNPNQMTLEARVASCPTCQTRTRFSYAGEQHWPERVVRATGIAPVVRLWHCGRCRTTVSEYELTQ